MFSSVPAEVNANLAWISKRSSCNQILRGAPCFDEGYNQCGCDDKEIRALGVTLGRNLRDLI